MGLKGYSIDEWNRMTNSFRPLTGNGFGSLGIAKPKTKRGSFRPLTGNGFERAYGSSWSTDSTKGFRPLTGNGFERQKTECMNSKLWVSVPLRGMGLKDHQH